MLVLLNVRGIIYIGDKCEWYFFELCDIVIVYRENLDKWKIKGYFLMISYEF